MHRVWKEAGLKPHRIERYLASDDPDFESKAADIIGPYLNTPQHAAVFCVDEKTAIQALDRLDPVLPLSPDAPSVTGLNIIVTPRCRCMRRWIRNLAKCSARPPPATPTRSLWSSSANLARDLAQDGRCRREGRTGTNAALTFQHHVGHLPAVRARKPKARCRSTQPFSELNCDQVTRSKACK